MSYLSETGTLKKLIKNKKQTLYGFPEQTVHNNKTTIKLLLQKHYNEKMSITVANTVGMFNLPKEIEDLICEYNVDHRPQMREVFHEMKRKQIFKEMKIAKKATLLPFIDYEECMNIECESIDAIREDPVREKRCGYWVTFCSMECSCYCARMVYREHRQRNWDTRYKVMIQEKIDRENNIF